MLPSGTKTLRFAITPYLPAERLARQFRPILGALSEMLGIDVELVTVRSYAELIELVVEGSVDIAVLPPLSYVTAKGRAPDLQLVAQQLAWGEPSFSSFVIVRADNPAQSLADLKGTMTFVDKNSTSGFLLPYHAFIQAGIDPETHFKTVRYAGTHVDAVRDLAEGRTDAAAIAAGMLDASADADQPVDVSSVRVLANAGRVPYDVVVVRGALGTDVATRVGRAFAAIDRRTARGRALLAPTAAITGWIQADDAAYDRIRDVRKTVDAYRGRRPTETP